MCIIYNINTYNCLVSMNTINGNLKISKVPLKQLKKYLKKVVFNSVRDDDVKNKLLE